MVREREREKESEGGREGGREWEGGKGKIILHKKDLYLLSKAHMKCWRLNKFILEWILENCHLTY